MAHKLDRENDWSPSYTKSYCIIQVISDHFEHIEVLYHTKCTDTGQSTAPKSFEIVVQRTTKSNRDATTAYSDCHDTVGRS